MRFETAARKIYSSVGFQKVIYFSSWCSAAWWLSTVSILLHRVRRGLHCIQILYAQRVHTPHAALSFRLTRKQTVAPKHSLTCLRVLQYLRGLSIVDPDDIRTIFLVFFTVFEPLRLLAGYYGNLGEKVRSCLAVATLCCCRHVGNQLYDAALCAGVVVGATASAGTSKAQLVRSRACVLPMCCAAPVHVQYAGGRNAEPAQCEAQQQSSMGSKAACSAKSACCRSGAPDCTEDSHCTGPFHLHFRRAVTLTTAPSLRLLLGCTRRHHATAASATSAAADLGARVDRVWSICGASLHAVRQVHTQFLYVMEASWLMHPLKQSCMWLSKLLACTLSAIDCVQLKQAYQAARRQQHFAPLRHGSGDTDKLEGDFGVTRTSKNVLKALRPNDKDAWNAHEPPQGQTQPLIQAGEEQSTRIHASANPLWQSEEHAYT